MAIKKVSSQVIADAEATRYIGAAGNPSFQNNWVEYANGFHQTGFYKDAFGIVHLTGLPKSGTVNQPIFTLPVGYRPNANVIFAVNAGGAWGTIYIYTTGAVTLVAGSNGFVSLDGISFRAEA